MKILKYLSYILFVFLKCLWKDENVVEVCDDEIEEALKNCNLYNRNKTSQYEPYRLLQPLPVPTAVWLSISLDFITKLPLSQEHLTQLRYDSILVVVCRLSKYIYFIPYKEASTAEELAYTFLLTVISYHGMPQELVTDRDKLFTSNF